MNPSGQWPRNTRPRRPRLLGALLLLLCLLLPAGPWAPAAPAQTPAQVPHFTGLVQYDPGGALLPQAGVPVFLYGYPQSGGPPVLLRSALTAPDGSFDLYTRTTAFSAYVVLKDEVRGLVPFTATPGLNGRLWDSSAVFYPADSNNHDTRFLIRDALRLPFRFRERYLIVTSAAVVPGLEDFIAYKEFLGFDVRVITVEELDPTGIGGQYRRDQIRAYERSLYESPGGLKYVLLIGTDDTIPFLKVVPEGADWVRYPYEEWPDECTYAGVPYEANMCGRSTDWYYVDLYSDWDSNDDGVLGEGFWAPPKKIKDNPPAFHVDVYLGRLPFDNAPAAMAVLDHIMAFEQDDGDWKKHVLLAGAMLDLGGWAWDPPDNVITGTYKPAHGPTDNAYLMEQAYSDYLEGEGFQAVRLYEKDHPPNCNPPSSFPADAPLTLENMTDQWTSQDFGLVKVAGHGSGEGVGRRVWARDYDTPCVVENPTRPFTDNKSLEEIDRIAFLLRDNAGQMLSPSAKAPVLMAMSCSTGAWYTGSNLAAVYLLMGRIAAWIGGTYRIGYTYGWKSLSQDGGHTADYKIGEAIFKQNLPLGDGFWTGLDNFHQQFGANWGNGSYPSAFISLDLYGDPSMDYWGNGADRGPWPMFHYDWAGRGQTSLAGPGLIGQTYWTVDIAPTPAGSRVPSPVINRDDRIVIGDASGVVRSIDMAGNVLWSYPTDGPIDTAPALGLAGTIYVQTRNGTLYAIRENGTLYWSRTVGQSDASPKVGPNGWIYVGGSDNNGPGGSTRYLLMAYRVDGERKALVELDGPVTTTPSFGKDGGVLVGTAAGTLYELTPYLQVVGAHPLGLGYGIGSGLAVADDVMQTVLVPTAGGPLIAWSNLYNSPLWVFSGCGPLRSAPAVSQEGMVVFGSQDGKVYGIRLADGEKVWEYDTGGPVDSSPALDPVFAYVVGGNPARLYTLRIADGTFFPGSIEIGGNAQGGSSPAIGESKMLYVASAEGALYAIGKINWPQPPKLYARAWPWEIVVQIHPADGTSWHLLERRLPGGQWSVRAELGPGVTEFHDSTVQPGLRYQYRALAYDGIAKNAAGTQQQPEYSEYSPIVQVQALRAVPEAPAAPTVTPLSSSELRLEWPEAPTASIALRIWRLDPGAPDYAEIALLPGEATSFDDGELLSNTTYFYRLQAVDEAGDSPLSEPGNGTTWARTLPPPRQVTVYPLEDWAFRVCWVPGGTEYESVVAREAAGEMEAGEIGRVAPGQTCLTDTHGFPSSFVYQVKHVAGQDESEWALSAPTEPPDWLVVHAIYLPVVLRSAGP